MVKDTVNIPYKSRWIGGFYLIITAFIVILYSSIYLYSGLYTERYFFKAGFNIIMFLVFLLMFVTTLGFYSTKYRIENGVLKSVSPFISIRLNLKDIKSVEKIVFPFNFRVGSSFYSGYFYVPNKGWFRSIITNLRDTILIMAKDGKLYMITPSNPERFIKILRRR